MRLAIRSTWVIENLEKLGPGAFYHLAYATSQIHPDVLRKLKVRAFDYGKVDIYCLREDRGLWVASGEVIAVHWYPEFLRIHFMITEVNPSSTREIPWTSSYMVLPSRPGWRDDAAGP